MDDPEQRGGLRHHGEYVGARGPHDHGEGGRGGGEVHLDFVGDSQAGQGIEDIMLAGQRYDDVTE